MSRASRDVIVPITEYLSARADRAISRRLRVTHSLHETERQRLRLVRRLLFTRAEALRVGIGLATAPDLAVQIATYHQAVGKLERRVEQLGQRLTRLDTRER